MKGKKLPTGFYTDKAYTHQSKYIEACNPVMQFVIFL